MERKKPKVRVSWKCLQFAMSMGLGNQTFKPQSDEQLAWEYFEPNVAQLTLVWILVLA